MTLKVTGGMQNGRPFIRVSCCNWPLGGEHCGEGPPDQWFTDADCGVHIWCSRCNGQVMVTTSSEVDEGWSVKQLEPADARAAQAWEHTL